MRNVLNRQRKIICLDFDGVIHSHLSRWRGPGVIPSPPVKGAKEAIAELRKRFKIVIFSGRCNYHEGQEGIKVWLKKWEIMVDEVCEQRPNAFIFIDDRAIQFNGDWLQCLDSINKFKQWQCKVKRLTHKKGNDIILKARGKAKHCKLLINKVLLALFFGG